MSPDGTVQILWKCSDLEPKNRVVSLKNALAMRKKLLQTGYEVKIVIMKEGRWVTVSETKGWET
jgi:hypothetical protein